MPPFPRSSSIIAARPQLARGRAGGISIPLADPTQLPEASSPGQTRDGSFTYGRSLSAGQTYVDPLSAVTMLKASDASTPTSNSGVRHGYATSGPRISLPWVHPTTGHRMYYIANDVPGYIMTLDATDRSVAWSSFGDMSETAFAFSMHPSTPRVAYVWQSGTKQVRRYNLASAAYDDTGNWPWNIAATGAEPLDWLGVNENDTWLTAMLRGNGTFVAFKPGTGAEISASQARTGLSHDELHIDLKNQFAYLSVNNDASNNTLWDLEADTLDTSPDSQTSTGPMSDDHNAGGYGFAIGAAHFEANGGNGGAYRFDGDLNTNVNIITHEDNYVGIGDDWYTNADWIRERPGDGSKTALWHMITREAADSAGAKVRYRMMGVVKNDGSSVRIFGCTDTNAAGQAYDLKSKARMSPDGRIVVWTSDMNGSGRTDVFIGFMPLS